MQVKDCMSKEVIWANWNNTLYDVAKLMNENHIGSVPVCDDNKKLVGIITDRDIILRGIACDKDIKQTKATDIMTTKVIRTSKDTELDWVADIMAKNQIRRVPVVEDEKLVGMISVGDLARNENVDDKQIGTCMCHICDCTDKNAE